MNTNAVIINPKNTATASVIWLHGLGADGHDFEPIVAEFPRSLTDHIRFIFPHAPHRSITINGGMVMRAWYDVINPDLTYEQDSRGTQDSARIVQEYITQQITAGIPSDRIVLAGFSQGGAIALYTGLRYYQPLAGILALSCYLPLADHTEVEKHAANQATKILMLHGQFDPVIPVKQGELSINLLKQLGYAAQWRAYPMQHSVHPKEIIDIAHWLGERLP